MKRSIKKLVMLVGLMMTFLTAAAYDFEVDGIQYKIISIGDRTCSVEKITDGAGEMVTLQEKVTYKNAQFSIIQIEPNCASSVLKELDMENCAITELSGSFSSSTLESVKLPTSLTSIGDYAFSGCTSLASLSIPNTVTTIGVGAFENCFKLVECSLPSALKIIGGSAFSNCKALKSISIPPYVEKIRGYCFESCISLSDLVFEGKSDSPAIEIPKLATDDFWNFGAFTDCNPSSIEINRVIRYTPYTNGGTADCLFEKAPHTLKIGMVPNSIPYGLFRTGTPSNLIISDRTSLLELPRSYVVENLYLGGNVNKSIKANNVQISDFVTSLPDFFFAGSHFRHIILPSSIESIGVACFSGCSYLEEVEIPSSVKIIPVSAFSNCSSLKKIILNEELETIEMKALEGVDLDIIECRSMTAPSVAEDAFNNKSYLNATLIVKKDAVETYQNAENWRNFFNIKYFTPVTGLSLEPKDVLLEVGNSLSINVEYLIDEPDGYPLVDFKLIWVSDSPEIVLVNDKGELKASTPGETIVQAYPSNNTSIIGQCSVKVIPEIPDYFEVSGIRYHRLNNLQVELAHKVYSGDLLIPGSVTYNDLVFPVIGIEDNAFSGCPNLNSIQIPGSIQKLANDLFSDIDKLQKVVIESGNTSLIVGYNSKLNLSSSITPFPNPSDVDERRTGFRNGYYDGLFYGLPIERLVINRDIEMTKYYERTVGSSTSSYSTVYNDIVYYPPFYGLTSLKYVEIGENVSAICKNQIEAVVNALPTTMEYTNFGKCGNIEVVVSNNPNAPIGGGFSQPTYENATLFLPNGDAESYRNDEYWKRFSHIMDSPYIETKSIDFGNDEIVIGLNESMTLLPNINPDNASIKKLKWISSTPSIVSVSEEGVITSYSHEGECVITAMACDGSGAFATIKIRVQAGVAVSDVLADGKYSISVEDGSIIIEGKAEGDVVEIFNLQGQRITSSSNNVIDLKTKGIFIIRIGSNNSKIIL